ncbi:MAG: hypothetical protein H0X49_10485, partial [Acidobacteria bacterium]|nr:hypothetical protein [Acidobacteriota bacterium]
MNIELSEPSKEGECRARCPKCAKDRSFALNTNSNRFNCFAKGCNLKGGGVIDFFGKLYETTAKEASHLLACAYGIQPYFQEMPIKTAISDSNTKTAVLTEPVKREVGDVETSPDACQTVPPLTTQHL